MSGAAGGGRPRTGRRLGLRCRARSRRKTGVGCMVTTTHTVAFEGVEARRVEVQCALGPGLPGFAIVGLPDKAVSEARERVRAALAALSIALPSKRITVSLAPADLPKEGPHFDLPIALGLLAAIGVLSAEDVLDVVSLGELGLDGRVRPVPGALHAALMAAQDGRSLLCPKANGAEAAWVGAAAVCGLGTLAEAIGHLSGDRLIEPAQPGRLEGPRQAATSALDLADVKGQVRARRALEVAAAGRHHLLLVGPPGNGKSMLAARLPGILPDLTPEEALETSMIHSLAGALEEGGIARQRPFRQPHATASMVAMTGGGRHAHPGEMSLAHNGVLFLDELPEFSRSVLEALRQPIETGRISVARARAHVQYPSRFLLVGAANPCRCGHLADAARACARVPRCGADYLGRISGPVMDRFDLRIEMPAHDWRDAAHAPSGEPSSAVAARVTAAHALQADRFATHPAVRANAEAEGRLLEEIARPDAEGQALLLRAAERFGMSARGYHRVLRTARTIADLDRSPAVRLPHLAEAISYRVSFASASG